MESLIEKTAIMGHSSEKNRYLFIYAIDHVCSAPSLSEWDINESNAGDKKIIDMEKGLSLEGDVWRPLLSASF